MDLLPRVGGQVEDEHGEEGDAHAGDNQVHLEIVTMKIRSLINYYHQVRLNMISVKIRILIKHYYQVCLNMITMKLPWVQR